MIDELTITVNTVQHRSEGGYILNGKSTVPEDPSNKHYRAIQDWIAAGNTPGPVPLETVRADKATEVDADFQAEIQSVREGYHPDEIESWPQQEQEARAYTADNTASVPLLENMATTRNTTVADLASRILNNAQGFAQVYGQALGKRQRRQSELAAIDLTAPDAADQIAAV